MANAQIGLEMAGLRQDVQDALTSAEKHRQAWLEMSEQYHALKAQVDALAQRYKWFPTEPPLLFPDATTIDPNELVRRIDAVIAYSNREAAEGQKNGAAAAFAVAEAHFRQMENLSEIDERTLSLILKGLSDCERGF